jgi:single-strand DNA-binding protein
LQKGRQVFVEGILQSRSWETTDKQKRSTIDVRAERIQFLGGPKGVEGINDAAPEAAAAKASSAQADVQEDVISPEDIAWEE